MDERYYYVRIAVNERQDLPGYGVIQLGEAYVPVMMGENGWIRDCFTSGERSVTGCLTMGEAWEVVERDFKIMHP